MMRVRCGIKGCVGDNSVMEASAYAKPWYVICCANSALQKSLYTVVVIITTAVLWVWLISKYWRNLNLDYVFASESIELIRTRIHTWIWIIRWMTVLLWEDIIKFPLRKVAPPEFLPTKLTSEGNNWIFPGGIRPWISEETKSENLFQRIFLRQNIPNLFCRWLNYSSWNLSLHKEIFWIL